MLIKHFSLLKQNILPLAILSLVAILAVALRVSPKPTLTDNKPYLEIAGKKVTVEVSDTTEKTQRGLSNRDPLPKNTGMLFVFTEAQQWPFWMKDMKFALDFIWINDNKVVDLHENIPGPAQTEGIPATIVPRVPIKQVLEINAGWIKENGIKVGDSVTTHL